VRRLLLFALLIALVLSAAANGAAVDPATLVLRQSDVPATYRLNDRESGARTIAQDSADYPGLKAKYRSWGHLAGYQIRFDRGDDSIVSRADVFRGRAGSRQMLAWYVAQAQSQKTPIRLRLATLALGDEAVTLSFGGGGLHFALAVWRYGRTVSIVGGAGLARARVLALARTQQRRVAAALR